MVISCFAMLKDDARQTIELSKFGFLRKGFLSVDFSDLKLDGDPELNRGTVSIISVTKKSMMSDCANLCVMF